MIQASDSDGSQDGWLVFIGMLGGVLITLGVVVVYLKYHDEPTARTSAAVVCPLGCKTEDDVAAERYRALLRSGR